jgi:hypothetical protein
VIAANELTAQNIAASSSLPVKTLLNTRRRQRLSGILDEYHRAPPDLHGRHFRQAQGHNRFNQRDRQDSPCFCAD